MHYLNQFLCGLDSFRISTIFRVDHVISNVVLQHLGHKAIHSAARRSDEAQDFRTVLLIRNCAFEGVDLATNALHSMHKFFLISDSVCHILLDMV